MHPLPIPPSAIISHCWHIPHIFLLIYLLTTGSLYALIANHLPPQYLLLPLFCQTFSARSTAKPPESYSLPAPSTYTHCWPYTHTHCQIQTPFQTIHLHHNHVWIHHPRFTAKHFQLHSLLLYILLNFLLHHISHCQPYISRAHFASHLPAILTARYLLLSPLSDASSSTYFIYIYSMHCWNMLAKSTHFHCWVICLPISTHCFQISSKLPDISLCKPPLC